MLIMSAFNIIIILVFLNYCPFAFMCTFGVRACVPVCVHACVRACQRACVCTVYVTVMPNVSSASMFAATSPE